MKIWLKLLIGSAVGLLLAHGRPIGREALAARLGVDLETYREVHEPWLERTGLVERTEWGRAATAKARALYGAGAEAKPVAKCAARSEALRALGAPIPAGLWAIS